MPTATGNYTLADFINELQARGFAGFTVPDLTEYINRGYFAVARRSRWFWEETSGAFTVNPGTPSVPLTVLPNFRSLDKLTISTSGYQNLILEMSDEEFYDNWLPNDLTQTSFQGEPTNYYLWNNHLYILPTPNAVRNFLAYYHQTASRLVASTDAPITPPDYDEAITLAAIVRCHTRANEPQLATYAQQELDQVLEDMMDEENTRIGEHQHRVKPDNTWL